MVVPTEPMSAHVILEAWSVLIGGRVVVGSSGTLSALAGHCAAVAS
jgi:hypothetical protein